MIELKDIVVKFGDFEALHNINVNVKEGQNDHPAHHHRLY